MRIDFHPACVLGADTLGFQVDNFKHIILVSAAPSVNCNISAASKGEFDVPFHVLPRLLEVGVRV